ncbi:MAG: hypothetical protein H7308_11170 [Chthonomonadaceae bacterium]|nr:hypothetical protein [Chthonomonadaceae bacterium]
MMIWYKTYGGGKTVPEIVKRKWVGGVGQKKRGFTMRVKKQQGFLGRIYLCFLSIGITTLPVAVRGQIYPVFTLESVGSEMLSPFFTIDPAYRGLQECIDLIHIANGNETDFSPERKRPFLLSIRQKLASAECNEALWKLNDWLNRFSAPSSQETIRQLSDEWDAVRRFPGAPAPILRQDTSDELYTLVLV